MNTDTVIKNLQARRFLAERFTQNDSLKQRVLELIGNQSVGIGGSASVKELGLYEALIAHGNTVYCHTYVEETERKDEARALAMGADVYLCSANAITESGVIINIDGTGNRVAATMFGPRKVIVIAGVNKLAKDVEDGLDRIKRECCPQNARRLGLDTPCAVTGECTSCHSKARMCNATVLLEYPTRHAESFHVLLSDEKLGW